jgi:hypothetical protein
LLEDLPNKVRDVLGVVVDVNLCTENGREYLEIVVPAYANPISYNRLLKNAPIQRSKHVEKYS